METLKHFFSKTKKAPSFKKLFSYSPEYIWGAYIIVTAVLVILIGIFSWFYFRMITSDSIFDSEAVIKSNQLIQYKKLEAVLDHYKGKAQQFRTLSETKPTIVDPSL